MLPLGDVAAASGEWECMECGYVVEGVPARRPKECPECGAPSQAFEFFSFEDEEEGWDADEPTDDEELEQELEDEDVF